jgi:hypothetical protein
MDEERPAFFITACIILMIAVGLAVIHGLAPKKSAFVWPVAWCWNEDASLSAPCSHIPRQQDI